jgi:SPP1 family predicted phage head-tail adaptor
MNAGNYNQLLTLQTLSQVADIAGGTRHGTWTDAARFFASVEPMTGRRLLEYSQHISGKGYIITTHYMSELATLTERARLVMQDGTTMAIHSIVNVKMQNQYFELICDDGK